MTLQTTEQFGLVRCAGAARELLRIVIRGGRNRSIDNRDDRARSCQRHIEDNELGRGDIGGRAAR